ncbi:TetR/AcrR family transcriptional regulator [Saccharomonospora sp. CUA-673]|uniref:TetR/AcrR family transcriptional regulator n=1 Tax=Saccharomonospora sp. CUA-673 TaxID=1904969 RepID=UPI001115136D|nr:TetR/AcrR family transcriptional regulator [Saccharomonospora sp. CUA-673]
MTTSDGSVARDDRAQATRDAILSTAERLFAERGVYNVSNRQISEAAGQGNNAAVHYHFGTKHDLIAALVDRHLTAQRRRRATYVAQLGANPTLRDWVACVVLPVTDHLAELGRPTWQARFKAQLVTDPTLQAVLDDTNALDAALQTTIDGVHRCVTHLPAPVRAERADITKHLMVHMAADRERAIARDLPTPRATWREAAEGLIDAIVGIWEAPVSDAAQPRG